MYMIRFMSPLTADIVDICDSRDGISDLLLYFIFIMVCSITFLLFFWKRIMLQFCEQHDDW